MHTDSLPRSRAEGLGGLCGGVWSRIRHHRRPGERDGALFDRLRERVQQVRRILTSLIEKQHTTMCECALMTHECATHPMRIPKASFSSGPPTAPLPLLRSPAGAFEVTHLVRIVVILETCLPESPPREPRRLDNTTNPIAVPTAPNAQLNVFEVLGPANRTLPSLVHTHYVTVPPGFQAGRQTRTRDLLLFRC